MNPYLPPWEYIPDGEPHIFDGRVYVYGSHDRAHGFVFCQEDYVCWSAPVENLSEWRYDGVIYKKTQDPFNKTGHMVLYAPDVTQGPDGRFYLYYVLDKVKVVSVAVCDTPAGAYEFYGYVTYPDGTKLGEKDGDEPQFDPGVLTEGDKVYLYTGLGVHGDEARHGAMVTVLAPDMLTIVEAPAYIVPSGVCGKGTSFEGHEFFEAPSMRRVGDMYYFIYSSVHMTELCYATSASPTGGFAYGGVVVSNSDLGISSYKPAEKRTYPYGNNHGSIIEINGMWYVFYHRMTGGTWFSRQACIEPITIDGNGRIAQVEMTSQGAAGRPFTAKGKHPAYMACNLWNDVIESGGGGNVAIGVSGSSVLPAVPPKITQEGGNISPPESPDGFTPPVCYSELNSEASPPLCIAIGSLCAVCFANTLVAHRNAFYAVRDANQFNSLYIADITDGTTIGFKYFDCRGVRKITLTTRAYGRGSFEVRTDLTGEVLGVISIVSANIWTEFSGEVNIPDGVHALYFTYKGGGTPHLLAFEAS